MLRGYSVGRQPAHKTRLAALQEEQRRAAVDGALHSCGVGRNELGKPAFVALLGKLPETRAIAPNHFDLRATGRSGRSMHCIDNHLGSARDPLQFIRLGDEQRLVWLQIQPDANNDFGRRAQLSGEVGKHAQSGSRNPGSTEERNAGVRSGHGLQQGKVAFDL